MRVYLAGDLEGDDPWIKEVVGGGKEGEQVYVDKEQLEGQRMVVMKEQRFFYVDIAGVGEGEGEGDFGCCSEKQQRDVRCRRSAVVFLPYSVGRDVKECERLLAGEAGKDGVLPAGVRVRVEECLALRSAPIVADHHGWVSGGIASRTAAASATAPAPAVTQICLCTCLRLASTNSLRKPG